jgi:PAS domain S-box/PAS domain S-box
MALAAEGSFRVLHVDDEPALIDVTADFLVGEDDRFSVEAATSASEALERLDDDIDCIISDYDMPGLNGIEFLEAVREERPELPFILFTGKGSEAVASEAISAGVTDYLQKETGTEQYTLLANRVRNAIESNIAERAARLAQDRVEGLLARPADFIYALTADGTVTSVTPAVERVLGWEAAELDGTGAFEPLHPEDRDAVVDAFERALEEPNAEPTASGRVEHADGSWRWLCIRFRNCLADQAIEAVLANVRDITEQQTCMQELDRYRTLVQTAGDAMYALDEDGYIEMVNASHIEWSGYSETELVGTHVSEFMPAEAVEEGIDLTVELLKNPEKERGRFEFPATRPDGEERIYEDNIAVLTDEDGNYTGSIGIIRDITEQKRRERALERQNERLDNFATIISHDIRNPLQVASGNLAQARATGDEAAFEKVEAAHERIDEIIDDVLTLARHGQSVAETEPTSLNAVARDAWATVDTQGMSLETRGDKQLEAEPDRLRQLLENLFRNALEHAGPDVTVTVGPIQPMHTSTRAAHAGGSGFYVADNGPGISEDEREDVLNFGYSTAAEGTGFGLAIVSQIADAHGWETT